MGNAGVGQQGRPSVPTALGQLFKATFVGRLGPDGWFSLAPSARLGVIAKIEHPYLNHADQGYGDLIRIDPIVGGAAQVLRRVPLGTAVAKGGIDESSLRDLLFEFPETLPLGAIDAAFARPVPVCRELSTPAGYVDALYVNPLGRLVLAEFKLWRNPQARREVIGQILDYAKEFASWTYEDLQREVSRSLGRKGNVLYELARGQAPDLDEASFVDNVSRHLERGEFLLLIIGDGIREGVENIVDFVQRYSGLHFSLALVEAALYRDTAGRIVVQPRCLARTQVVQRLVFGEGVPLPEGDGDDEPRSPHEEENVRFWSAVLRDYAFSDVAVDVPKVPSEPSLFVTVPDSGFGNWGLWFSGYLQRGERHRLLPDGPEGDSPSGTGIRGPQVRAG